MLVVDESDFLLKEDLKNCISYLETYVSNMSPRSTIFKKLSLKTPSFSGKYGQFHNFIWGCIVFNGRSE